MERGLQNSNIIIGLEKKSKKLKEDLIDNNKIAITTVIRKKRTFANLLVCYFKKKPVNEISELDVLRWQTWIQQKGYCTQGIRQ